MEGSLLLGQHAYLLLSVIALISMLVSQSLASFSIIDQKPLPPATIVLYLQGMAGVAYFNILKPISNTSNVGLVNVGKELVTNAPSLSSKQLGTWSTLDIESGTGPPYSSVQILSTVLYDDGVYKGSIVQHGEVDFNATTGELAVVGGTGDFVGVQGYSVRKFNSSSVIGNITVNVIEYTLHLLYRQNLACKC